MRARRVALRFPWEYTVEHEAMSTGLNDDWAYDVMVRVAFEMVHRMKAGVVDKASSWR